MTDHTHVTKLNFSTLQPASINASVFQGSAIGPALFLLNSMDLIPLHSNCSMDKYADDTYLIVPAGSDHHIQSEIHSIEIWAKANNLKLNTNKCQEMVIYPSEKARTNGKVISPLPSIERVQSMKILGVVIDKNLGISKHIDFICQAASQSLYAIKLLKAHGLDKISIHNVCKAVVISRLIYAVPAWWGFSNADDRQKLQAVVNRAIKWDFYKATDPCIQTIVYDIESKLFFNILNNKFHVLYQFLPPVKSNMHNLRPKAHNRELPNKTSALVAKNFLSRLLYQTLNPTVT